MSFQRGIIFIGKKNVACSYNDKGKQINWTKPLKVGTFLELSKLVFFSMPMWFHGLLFILLAMIILPPFLSWVIEGISITGLPRFTLLFFLFGTHFWFPGELKKYHGAEHKVFSYKGIISVVNRKAIKNAKITNRNCSTNSVFLYFLLVFLLTLCGNLLTELSWLEAVEYSAYISLGVLPFAAYWLNRTKETFLHRWILLVSYWLQKYITTSEPDSINLNTAIRSYRQLALKEFPYRVRTIQKRKERKLLAIADVTIIPIGTETTSVSDVVVEIHRILKESDKDIFFELTPMSTLIEGELPVLLEVIKEIHEVPFKLGHKRVATNIRIDDRRDRTTSMSGKLNTVNIKLAADDKKKEEEEEN
ncbi:uncharacterized protein (TIGR00106 family) [Evansella vedderi]|uniref:Uncharacterized protein (TIGR00106 family) n=1 Tax=Evansella vedderi TaxID=38282 RepID=A0ABT9ZVD7_9BACI|nr:uncharacterized protein (TIGR00106 family) [Evansella vedderi]